MSISALILYSLLWGVPYQQLSFPVITCTYRSWYWANIYQIIISTSKPVTILSLFHYYWPRIDRRGQIYWVFIVVLQFSRNRTCSLFWLRWRTFFSWSHRQHSRKVLLLFPKLNGCFAIAEVKHFKSLWFFLINLLHFQSIDPYLSRDLWFAVGTV